MQLLVIDKATLSKSKGKYRSFHYKQKQMELKYKSFETTKLKYRYAEYRPCKCPHNMLKM